MDTCKINRRVSLLCLAIAGAACLAGTAQAQTHDWREAHTLKVGYADLNLTTLEGATKLYNRIRGAARFVCGEEGRSLDEQRLWKACFHATVTDAVTTVHSPLLTTLDSGAASKATATALLTR